MLIKTLPILIVYAILALGTFLGLTIGPFLLINKSAKTTANKYLGLLLLVIITYFIPPLFHLAGLSGEVPHIIGIMRVAPFLLGPLAYLYVCACTQKGFELRLIALLHFIPFLLDIGYHLPFYMQTAAEKLAFAVHVRKTGEVLEHPLWLALKSISLIVYFALSAKIIFQYRKHLTNTTSSIDKAFHRWLLIFIIIVSLPMCGLLGFVYADYQLPLVFFSILCLLSLILAVYIAALVKPELFHAFPHQMPIPESQELQKEKYENSRLKDSQKEQYLHQLKTFVEREKPFESSDLTLPQLAEQVNIPSNYLSQVINEKLKVNFLDFINGYRVKAAQDMLTNPKFSHYTILSIAYDAGFNSKSTFYTAFKKSTGMTPTAYRKQKVAA